MTFKLDIRGHVSTTMMTSLMYKRLSDLLLSRGRKELFSFIKSMKINGGSLLIKTEKPIVNSELQMFQSEITEIFTGVLSNFGIIAKEIKVSFR